jgi:hypothetical protein
MTGLVPKETPTACVRTGIVELLTAILFSLN